MRSIRTAAAVSAAAAITLGSVAPALAAGSVSPGSGGSGAGPKYAGRTSQHQTISFAISKGKAAGKVGWLAPCTTGGTLNAGTNFKANYSGGRFHLHGTYKAPVGGTPYMGHFTVTLSGKVSGSKASGTWHAKVGLYEGSRKAGSCKTGNVTWHAKK
jgi:hypothetical protein